MPRPPRELRPHASARAFFGSELRHWRNKRGYSQAELGSRVLMSGDAVGKVETASRWPTDELAQRCDTVLETGGALTRILPLVRAERAISAAADGPTDATRPGRHHPVPPLDHTAVKRPGVHDSVVESLMSAAGAVQPAPVVIAGPGGFGKTVLALQVCRDHRVIRSFDSILWVETGPQCTPARTVQLVADICEQLQGERLSIANPDQAGFRLAEALADRTVLLVIDNVWTSVDLAPLLLGGPNCVRLVTTRNLGVCRSRSAALRIPAMSEGEIRQLLANNYPGVLAWSGTRQLARLCGGWPLLASVIGASVAHDIAAGASETAALHRAMTAVREDGPQALDVWDDGQRAGSIVRAVASSLRSLDEDVTVPGANELGERYLDLAIFPAAVPIPMTVLERWWQHEHGWTITGVRQFARVLAERSLLGAYLADEDAIVLHDVFRSCLEHLARRPLIEAHKSLIGALRTAASGAWHRLGHDERYLWRYLTHHLDSAGYAEEVINLLADPAFVVTKMTYVGHDALVEDGLALTSASVRAHVPDQLPVARALVNASYLAADTRRHDDIRSTLLGALGWAGQLETPAARWLQGWTADAFDVRWVAPDTADSDGHTGAVASVAVTQDRVVSAGEDGTVRIWDRASRRLLRVLRGHHGWVYAVAVSPAADLVASAGDDRVIRLWNATTGRLTAVLAGHTQRVRSLAFDRAGARLLSGSEDGGVVLWSTEPAARLHDLNTDRRPTWAVAISPDDTLAAAGGQDTTVRLYDLAEARLVSESAGHHDWVRSVAFAADSSLLASGSGDGRVCLWNITESRLALLRSTPTPSRVRALSVSADAATIHATGEDAVVRTITADGITEQTQLPAGVDWIRTIAGIDGDEDDDAALGCEDGAVRILRNGGVSDLAPGRQTVWSTAFLPDGPSVLVGRSDGTINRIGPAADAAERRFDADRGRVWALHAAAGYVAAACGDGAVRAWSLTDESWSAHLHPDGLRTWSVAVHPAGRALAASSGTGTLRVWDLPSGRLRWQRAAHTGRVRSLTFDTTGSLLATGGGDGLARVWDSDTGEQRNEVRSPAGWVRTVAVDHTSTRLAVGLGSGDVGVHTLPRGGRPTRHDRPAHLFGHSGRVLAAAFIGDDELLTAAADGTVRLWSLRTQRQIAQMRVDASLQCASVDSRTGSVLASSSAGVILLQLRRPDREDNQ